MEILARNIVLAFSALVAAYLVVLVMIQFIIRLSHHKELFDAPDERKIHTGKISRLGGIGMFSAFLFSAAVSPFIIGLWLDGPFAIYGKILPKILFIIPTVMMFTVGVMDDFFGVKWIWKLALQLAASVIVVIAGATFDTFTIPFVWKTVEFGWFAWPATIAWIILVTNAINLIDGMDGLSATIAIIAFAVYGIVFLLDKHFVLAIISFVLVGTIWGYLMYNFPPARIFMGDSGSLVLGFLLAVLPLVARSKIESFMYIPLTLLLIPIVDVVNAVVRRWSRGQPFSTPDREHLHHKLLDLGLKERFILMIVSSVLLVCSLPLVLLTVVPVERVGVLVVATWLLVVAGILFVNFLYRRRAEKAGDED